MLATRWYLLPRGPVGAQWQAEAEQASFNALILVWCVAVIVSFVDCVCVRVCVSE